jgi:hypothetical protein
MKALTDLILELRAVDLSRSDGVVRFESLLADIIAHRNPDAIPLLLPLFDDHAPYNEVMFSIIHGIEVFEDKVYVDQVLRGAVDFCIHSPRWASIVFMRMLNSESTRLALVRELRSANTEVKAAVKTLMEKINARGVQFIPKTTAVIVAAT